MLFFARTYHYGWREMRGEAETLEEAVEKARAEFRNRKGLPKMLGAIEFKAWVNGCWVKLARVDGWKTIIRRGAQAACPDFFETRNT